MADTRPHPSIDLPVVASTTARPVPNKLRSLLVHGVRLVMVVLLVATLRYAEQRRRTVAGAGDVSIPERNTERLVEWFGDTATEQVVDQTSRSRIVRDASGNTLGQVMQTLPETLSVTGYRGASNLLIGIDPKRRIVGVQLLSSQDTVDHVQAIEASPDFFSQFIGRNAEQVQQQVDVVSGATLTSLAMRDSIAVRLGATAPLSARFPQPLELDEAQRDFPAATSLQPIAGTAAEWEVFAADQTRLGSIARTGLLEDHLNGYQGPTELRLAFDPEGRLTGVTVRTSFDNQPYVSYIDDEPWYWDPFRGLGWSQLAASDLKRLQIEGVSGATMTSVAAAETLIAAARARVEEREAAARPVRKESRPWLRWSAKEIVTLGILGGAMLLTLTSLRGKAWLRTTWQWILIGVLGLLTGNLLSVALLMGWGTSGMAWQFAPGLAALLVVSLALAETTKSPFYCASVCPHGAAQQRLRNVLPNRFRWQPKRRVSMLLLRLPTALLVLAFWLTLVGADRRLSQLEPFDAWLWWTGAGGSVLLAIASLVLSLFSPMGYCRFGCPTGQLLSYIRWHRRAGDWTPGDSLAAGLLVAAWLWLLTN